MLAVVRMAPPGKLLAIISSVLSPKEKNPQSYRISLNKNVTQNAEAKALPNLDLSFMLCSTGGMIGTAP